MSLYERMLQKLASVDRCASAADATLTVAADATVRVYRASSVAPVARVAVATQKKSPSAMTYGDVEEINNWLWWIEERDASIRSETLRKCRKDPEALAYYLMRAKEVPPIRSAEDMHSCNACAMLSPTGVCKAAVKLGAMEGYKPVFGRKFNHRCPEWTIGLNGGLV